MPFCLEYDSHTSLIRQRRDPQIEAAFEKVYKIGSMISGTMDDFGIGKKYADDFLNFFMTQVGRNLTGMRILEIGCGTGYFLSLLKSKGAEVVGVEPGPHGLAGSERFGVPIINDFFPCDTVKGQFDVIVAYGVFEHIPDTDLLLKTISEFLIDSGQLIISVPDDEPCIKSGDISCLIHEHWYYFTKDSILSILNNCGFSAECIPAGFGGSLYCAARKEDSSKKQDSPAGHSNLLLNFKERAAAGLDKLSEILDHTRSWKTRLGIYVPGRLINLLSLADKSLWKDLDIRFFDDNEALRGKYYPGFPFPIESFPELEKEAVDSMIVASNTFGNVIIEKIKLRFPKINIISWNDLFNTTG